MAYRHMYMCMRFWLYCGDVSAACYLDNFAKSIHPCFLVKVSVGLESVGVARDGGITAADL